MENKALKTILENKAVAVIRMNDSAKLIKVAEAIYKGGVQSVEITMTVPGALKIIEEAGRTLGDHVNIGVGSVLNKQTANDAINAGAKYVVSPVFKPEIVQEAKKHNIPVMPGAFSPTEILTAFEAGADVVKVFPADIVGMAFFKGVLAPMPHLKLMPTGGVSLTNAGDWIKTGACAVGVGSALLDKKAIAEENYDLLTQNAEKLIASINNAKVD
ncbi:MAG: bifunctional 4-hydroxy-2-oxoglutarate aldolase/2-dehydro-3-deoxy-phosphogluconate aldolase [Ignavibacteriaceae bacterium]